MSSAPLTSPVIEFYSDAKILITGATGFLGKTLMEKLLRVCTNINHIYVLVRKKKEKTPQMRLKETLSDVLFDRLRQIQPDFEKKVSCIDGDVSFPNLGMSDEVFECLAKEITHVFHVAATVRFTEKLKTAIRVNVVGLKEIINFCNKCIHLKIFAHTSTAYVYYNEVPLNEEFKEAPLTGENSIALMNSLTEEQLDAITPSLLKPWPNTYCFTKIIAENIIKDLVADYPVLVLRPSIVMGTFKEPMPGWVDNINGPTGILVAAGAGILRVIFANSEAEANLVPVDMVINALICSAWETGTNYRNKNNNSVLPIENGVCGKTETISHPKKIYNFISKKDNPITWGDFLKLNLKHGKEYPTENFLWYYSVTLTRIKILFLILTALYHFIPGFMFDVAAVILGKKPQLLKAYKRIHTFSCTLAYFSKNDWFFSDENIQELWENLSETDKKIFPFNMSVLNWDRYFENIVKGIRLYFLKQSDSTLKQSRQKFFCFAIAHRLLQISLALLVLWSINCFALSLASMISPAKSVDGPILMAQKLMGDVS